VIVNKPGAGQTIGYLETHSAKPDGYTICWTSSTIVTSKLLGIIRYDHRDFTPLCRLYTAYPVIIASTKTQRPFKTIQEVILFAKSHPGEISLATTATGGPLWIATHVFQQATGLNFNIIPQEGSAGFVITQVVGGHTDLGVTFFPTAKPQVEAGNIRVLAVIGDERFSDKYDYIPTLKEIGYPVSYPSFATMLGPPNMPKPITEKLVQTFELAIKDPAVQKFWLSRYYFPSFLPPDQLMKFCDQQKEVYRAVLDKAKLLKEK